ncbi:class I SAM-dependent methyltransferase [Carboxylicivirga taeanensis]|uniref:class I SAM-dependent methyltransferase n=1 Tax=Carboxylicivirga taeanensis TaxID=1416875 RepID=UPI003F6E3DCF
MKEMWNERYASDEYFYGAAPNDLFKTFIDSNPPGKLLLPAEGEGRNAVYAATKGWEVTAVDSSEEAGKKALNLAKTKGVNIQYLIGDVQNIQLDASAFDYIACVFLHLPPNELTAIYRRLTESLKPNGKLLIIGFNKKQLTHSSGGPKNEEWLFSAEIIAVQFEGHHLLQCRDFTAYLNEGKGHSGKAELTVAEIQVIK